MKLSVRKLSLLSAGRPTYQVRIGRQTRILECYADDYQALVAFVDRFGIWGWIRYALCHGMNVASQHPDTWCEEDD